MKNIVILLVTFLLFSCEDSNDEIVTEDKYNVKIESYYKLHDSGTLLADTGTDVFVYYGVQTMDIAGYNIDMDGVLTIKNRTIHPNKHYKTNLEGKCEFPSDSESLLTKVTIILVSNYYKGKISQHSYLSPKSDIQIKVITSK